MNIRPRRTTEGLVIATDELITSVKQLKDGDLIMMGYVKWQDFMPYRVSKIEGRTYITTVSAISKHRFISFAQEVTDKSMPNLIVYRADVDVTDKTHPKYLYLAILLNIIAFVSLFYFGFVSTSIVLLLISLFCIFAARIPRP